MSDEIQDPSINVCSHTEEQLAQIYNDAKATRFASLRRPRRVSELRAVGPFPHGDFRHVCNVAKNEDCLDNSAYVTPWPDFPIRIERIGGGAAAVGYAAIVWPDEMHAVGLMDEGMFFEEWSSPVEDWTPEACFTRAILGLLHNRHHRLSEPFLLNFPDREAIVYPSDILSAFGVPWQRAALLHDIEDVCLAIDNGGLES